MKRRGLFWGIVLVLLGVLLLLQNLGLLPPQISVWGIFFAIIMIAVGIRMLTGGRGSRSKQEYETRQLSIPIESLSQAEIILRHGAGKMQIQANQSAETLLEGNFEGGVDFQQTGEKFSLEVPSDSSVFSFWPFEHEGTFDWKIGLCPSIPLTLWIYSGASDNIIDLSGLNVPRVRVQVGASSTQVILPRPVGECNATFRSGAASFQVKVPEGVAARIKLQSALTGVSVNTARFPPSGSGYESSDYASAADRVNISFETGVGSVDIS